MTDSGILALYEIAIDQAVELDIRYKAARQMQEGGTGENVPKIGSPISEH
ncbi:hypothetical protein [Paenibacillus rigui]|nr:hypothetical protein [Paenibacillus rigui]